MKKKRYFLLLLLTYCVFITSQISANSFLAGKEAQQYKQYPQAIQHYQERIADNDHSDEWWSAQYNLGCCYLDISEWDKAVENLLEAYQERPYIAEPLEKVVYCYRMTNNYAPAYYFAKLGMTIPYPGNILPDIHPDVYNYRFQEELSIICYYLGKYKEGLIYANELCLKKNLPSYVKSQAQRNISYYVRPIKKKILAPIVFDFPMINAEENLHYNAMNSSIVSCESGYIIVTRCVNYLKNNGKPEGMRLIDPLMRPWGLFSKNFYLTYDQDFNLTSQQEIQDSLPITTGSRCFIGMEDYRIINYKNELWGIGTTVRPNHAPTHADGTPTMTLGCLKEIENEIALTNAGWVLGPNPLRPEKNWLPFTQGDQLLAIYSYNPLTIYQIDPQTKEIKLAHSQDQEYDLSSLRGSAGPIPFQDGYLVLVHEMIEQRHQCYLYTQRFLCLDQNYNVTHVSPPFYFENFGVECCFGMTMDHSGNNLILTVSIDDAKAMIVQIDMDTILDLF